MQKIVEIPLVLGDQLIDRVRWVRLSEKVTHFASLFSRCFSDFAGFLGAFDGQQFCWSSRVRGGGDAGSLTPRCSAKRKLVSC